MIVNTNVLWELYHRVRWKDISIVSVFERDSDFFNIQQGNLGLSKSIKIGIPTKGCYVYHKSLIFLVQCRCRKLFFIKNLYFLGCRQCLGSTINFPDKLLLYKIYVCIAENEEKHPQDYFNSGVGHQKGLLEELNFSQLVLDWKACYNHLKDIQIRSINFLGSYISLPYAKSEFFGVYKVHCIDFAT